MSLPRKLAAVTVAGLLVAGGTATAAPRPKSYKNCTAMNKVYPHGVGRTGARDKTSTGNPVTNFKVSDRVYARNDGRSPRYPGEYDLDRDNDGVACEKS